MNARETFYDVMRRHGITRRSFLKFCSLTATAMGMGPTFAGRLAHALETKPRTPVVWLHGLECTCCTESFIRSGNPLASDAILSLISLDYDDTIMAAAGHQAEQILEDTIAKHKGEYVLACEGNPPLNEDGMFCIQAGRPYIEKLKHMSGVLDARDRRRLVARLGEEREVTVGPAPDDLPECRVPGEPRVESLGGRPFARLRRFA